MLRSIEIEHLASYDFEIAFRAAMPATQIMAIEADRDPRSYSIDFWICGSHWTQFSLNARRPGGFGSVPCER